MKKITFTVFFAVLATAGLLIYPLTIQSTYAQDDDSGDVVTQQTITVVGSGTASAPADSVTVRVVVGGNSVSYGPEGPKFYPYDEENLEILSDALITLGIDEESIHTNAFGRADYNPGSGAGVARFAYDEPQNLNSFMKSLLEELDEKRGPDLHGMAAVFQVDDCLALEAEAMQAAVDNAQERAVMMAAVMDAEASKLLSVSELSGARGATLGPATGNTCASLERSVHQMGFNPFAAGSGGENSPTTVEVSIALEATFGIQ
ncbi:MAG: SIMPL domain-containing protein [Chloroflexota bacterium]